MRLTDINIRDPFVFAKDGKYYLYGTRAADFGKKTGGFDVYVSDNLTTWSAPIPCFDSEKYGLNTEVNWAPEVHEYKGSYYMFATFTQGNGLRGTYILKADRLAGPFVPHSIGAVTPREWECLDGTLYCSKDGKPYLVFCHEHTQIIDGTVCYVQLTEDLKSSVGEATTLFAGSSPFYIKPKPEGEHYITDGPFMYRTTGGILLMLWSTSIDGKYAQCVAKSDHNEIAGNFIHLPPLITDDGGHGMVFKTKNDLMLTFHSPNQTGYEHPVFKPIIDSGEEIRLK